MPRGPRISFENAFYHIFNRGLNKEPIFHQTGDYLKFLQKLRDLKEKKHFDHSIYAYVLMPNHFHLIIQTKKTPIGKILSSLSTGYAMYFNTKYQRVGTLFQNRFKSKLCQKDDYFLGASRYIHLNPIVARLARDFADYPWSSYHEILGTSPFSIIDKVEIKRLIGDSPKDKEQYRKFLLSGLNQFDEIEKEYRIGQDIAGKPRFTTLSQKKYLRRQRKKTSTK